MDEYQIKIFKKKKLIRSGNSNQSGFDYKMHYLQLTEAIKQKVDLKTKNKIAKFLMTKYNLPEILACEIACLEISELEYKPKKERISNEVIIGEIQDLIDKKHNIPAIQIYRYFKKNYPNCAIYHIKSVYKDERCFRSYRHSAKEKQIAMAKNEKQERTELI